MTQNKNDGDTRSVTRVSRHCSAGSPDKGRWGLTFCLQGVNEGVINAPSMECPAWNVREVVSPRGKKKPDPSPGVAVPPFVNQRNKHLKSNRTRSGEKTLSG